jgi:hypothetical protein
MMATFLVVSPRWRQHDLNRRLAVWGPRVGEDATTMYAEGCWAGLTGILATLVWLVVSLVLLNLHVFGWPIAVTAVLFWPFILHRGFTGARMRIDAARRASVNCGVSGDSAPMKTVTGYERWLKRNNGVRYSERRA